MAFPKHPRKHLAPPLISAADFVRYKKFDRAHFPKAFVITWQKRVLDYFLRHYRGHYTKKYLSGWQNYYCLENVGFICLTGIGAPHAVTCLEELVAMGAQRFMTIGSAGGLSQEGIIVCNKALRDEGTSHHYLPHRLYAFPHRPLTRHLQKNLTAMGYSFTVGPTWTIDAPYRETVEEIQSYRCKGVLTVDMEAAALFAVAQLRQVQIATLFVVSDILHEAGWKPQFHHRHYRLTLNKMLLVAINTLSS